MWVELCVLSASRPERGRSRTQPFFFSSSVTAGNINTQSKTWTIFKKRCGELWVFMHVTHCGFVCWQSYLPRWEKVKVTPHRNWHGETRTQASSSIRLCVIHTHKGLGFYKVMMTRRYSVRSWGLHWITFFHTKTDEWNLFYESPKTTNCGTISTYIPIF